MEQYKSQALQDISIRIHSIKEDGKDNTGDAANLSTVILDPTGNELTGTTDYTEATFAEIGTTGEYECLFATVAAVDVFTSIDQDNPYTVSLISSTASVGASSKTIRIVSVYPWENALETTSQEILAQVIGTGNRVITINVKDDSANNWQDVLVRIGTASVPTDVSGNAVFALDDGDYDVILRTPYGSFTVPELLTVAGDGTHLYTGTLLAPSLPTQPDTCMVYGVVIDDGGFPVEGAETFINETDISTFANTQKIVKNRRTTSDVNGFWELEIVRSSQLNPADSSYAVIQTYSGFRWDTTATVPDLSSVEFSTIAGT